jgi:hypothetical protein
METTPNEQEYQGRKIVVAPSYTDTGCEPAAIA